MALHARLSLLAYDLKKQQILIFVIDIATSSRPPAVEVHFPARPYSADAYPSMSVAVEVQVPPRPSSFRKPIQWDAETERISRILKGVKR